MLPRPVSRLIQSQSQQRYADSEIIKIAQTASCTASSASSLGQRSLLAKRSSASSRVRQQRGPALTMADGILSQPMERLASTPVPELITKTYPI